MRLALVIQTPIGLLIIAEELMSCVFVSDVGWGKRLTGRRAQAHSLLAFALWLAVALPLAATCCSSGAKGADRLGWYDSGSVAFEADTRKGRPLLDPEHVLGVGDELEILYHSNLSARDLVIRRDGRISLPYVGDHMAAGITPMELDSLLEVRFSEILRDPSLAVIVSKPAPQRARLGEVRTPGQSVRRRHHDATDHRPWSKGAPGAVVLIRRRGSKIVGVEVDLQQSWTGQPCRTICGCELRHRVRPHIHLFGGGFHGADRKDHHVPLDAVFGM
jgi:hypothetical protein